MTKRILVIDDDFDALTLLQSALEHEGFDVTVARNGREGLRQAYITRPHLVLLDIVMPEMDGWETCQRLRYICDVPIIILSVKADQTEIVKGLSLGADDYMTKPYSFDELKSRIHARLRRTSSKNQQNWKADYDDGYLSINLMEGAARLDGRIVELTPTETRLLSYLVSQRGRVLPRRELLTNIWGAQYEDKVSYLSVYIRHLRQKIEEDPSHPRYVCTRWGEGYYFEGK
ncbi:MAG: response regulator transcription factor [Anaerolineae bacterium]|nr:response regulator transcription factor [Anaerolineae bacterium]